MRSTVLAALAIAATSAGAATPKEEWVRVGRHLDSGPVELDKKALTTSRGLTRVTWRIAFARPRGDGAAFEQHLMLVDCGLGAAAGVSTTLMAGDGSILSRIGDPERLAEQRLSTPTPGTTGETVAEAACAMAPGKSR